LKLLKKTFLPAISLGKKTEKKIAAKFRIMTCTGNTQFKNSAIRGLEGRGVALRRVQFLVRFTIVGREGVVWNCFSVLLGAIFLLFQSFDMIHRIALISVSDGSESLYR
jgi:hypothetical protein